MPENIKSKKQAGFFRLIASGKVKLPGLSQETARESLRGLDTKKLPEFANSPLTETMLKAFRGMTPTTLQRVRPPGAPPDFPPLFPSIHMDQDKFPILQRFDIGEKVAMIVEGRIESKRRDNEKEPTVVGLELLRAAVTPIQSSGPTPERSA